MADPTDHLTAVRAALAHAGKATPGPWSAELDIFDSDEGIVATISNVGTTMLATIGTDHVTTHAEWEADPIAAKEKADGQWRQARDEQEMRDAVAIVALRNAAPAIADLCREVERLRARIAKAEEVVAAARALGSYAWTDRLDDSRTSDDAKEDESKLSSAVWQYDNPPNLHPDGCHTTVASAFRDCSGDGHHECRTCTRFDEDERAKRIGEF